MKKTVLLCVLGAMTFGIRQSFAVDPPGVHPETHSHSHMISEGEQATSMSLHQDASESPRIYGFQKVRW